MEKTKASGGAAAAAQDLQTYKSQTRAQTLSKVIVAMREEWHAFEMQGSSGWSRVGFIVGLTVIKNILYWFHMYNRRF